MVALLVLIAVVALLVAGAFAFENHCLRRFDVSIFEIGRVLLNLAGWALVAAACCCGGMEGILLAVLGGGILLVQLGRLIACTSAIHGLVAFVFVSLFTLGILVILVLAIGAFCEKQSRHVIIID